MCQDALTFGFPAGPFVLFLYNPFDEELLARLLGRLHDSLLEEARHVVIVYGNGGPGHRRVILDTGDFVQTGSEMHDYYSVFENAAAEPGTGVLT